MIKHMRALVRGMLFVAALAGLAVTQPPAAHGDSKVTICHFPPGNPENAQTITVGAAAVPWHLALHGDCVGPCVGPG